MNYSIMHVWEYHVRNRSRIYTYMNEHWSGTFVFFFSASRSFLFPTSYTHTWTWTWTLIWQFCFFFPTSRSFVFPTTVYTYRNICRYLGHKGHDVSEKGYYPAVPYWESTSSNQRKMANWRKRVAYIHPEGYLSPLALLGTWLSILILSTLDWLEEKMMIDNKSEYS